MCRRKGKWKMLSLKKISRHIPRKILYPSVTEPKTVFALSSTQRLASFRSWQTSFPVPASTHIYRTVSLHLPIPLFFLFFLFVLSAHLFYIDIFSRKDKIRARGYTTRFAIYISRFHHVENSRWNRSFTSVAIAPRERIRMHKYVPPWNVLHLQFLFLNLFSRHLRPKFYGMSSNCISFFFFCFCLNCRSCSFCELHIFIE